MEVFPNTEQQKSGPALFTEIRRDGVFDIPTSSEKIAGCCELLAYEVNCCPISDLYFPHNPKTDMAIMTYGSKH